MTDTSSTPQPAALPSLYDLMKDVIPSDHATQSSASTMVRDALAAGFAPRRILDLGCGTGESRAFFGGVAPEAAWTGVDIELSPEVLSRTDADERFVVFDGVNLPFEDNAFDLVYSHQVFEHVRHPEALLRETARVLAPGGRLIGQTSQLEPYHSFSYWNYTVYGFRALLEAAGLTLRSIRPGIDGLTLIERSYKGRPPEYRRWFSEESPLNVEIGERVAEQRKSTRVANYRKLLYCGQFAFIAAG